MTLYDQECLDLARHFSVRDEDDCYRRLSEHEVRELAERIQETVDDYFHSLEPA